MRTQHSFCTQQVRYAGITRIVIFIWFEICVQKLRTDSFQEVLEAVLFGVGVYLQMLTVGSLVGAQLG